MKINLEHAKVIGTYGVRIGKTVIIEGCKAVVMNTAKTVIQTGFEDGLDSIKDLKWNDFLSDKEARVYKRIKKKEKNAYLKAKNAALEAKIKKMNGKVVEIEVDETEVTE